MTLIVASDLNGVIGREGKLPFNCQSDLAFFKAVTLGCVCHVGYNTYQSVKRIKDRKFLVVDKPIYEPGSIVIGGAATYKKYWDKKMIDCIYHTKVLANTTGDTFLPEGLDVNDLKINDRWRWEVVLRKKASKVDEFDFIIYKFDYIYGL